MMKFFLLFLHIFLRDVRGNIWHNFHTIPLLPDLYEQNSIEMAYIKEERYDEGTTAAIAEHYREILRLLGEDPEREGLVKTPERVAKALQFLTHGAQQDGAEILRTPMTTAFATAAMYRLPLCWICSHSTICTVSLRILLHSPVWMN